MNSGLSRREMFRPRRIGAPQSRDGAEFVLRQSRVPQRLLLRLDERAEAAFSVVSDMSLKTLPDSLLSLTGTSDAKFSATMWADVGVDREQSSRLWAASITISEKDGALVFDDGGSRPPGTVVFVDIVGPADRAVTIDAERTALEVVGVHAPVRITSSGAQVSVIGVSGDVTVSAHTGSIAWCGEKGSVRLSADGVIDVGFEHETYEGDVEAVAGSALTVWLPPSFRSAYEVDVDRADKCSYQPSLRPAVHRQTGTNRARLNFGVGTPRIRLSSAHGTVVVRHG